MIEKEIFNFSDNNYNLTSVTYLSRPILLTAHYGTKSIMSLGANMATSNTQY